jgi:DNA-binding response OmpR family regulator
MSARPTSILLVEDDARLAELVRSYLDSNGFKVTVETRGDLVLDTVRRENPDLIILDLGLPGRDGFSVCKELRQHNAKPILMLTARDDNIDQVLGLELGADDYIIKPVEPRVLLARINALLRRSTNPTPTNETRPLRFGRLTINPAARSATFAEQPLGLSSNEFDLLHLLSSRAGEVQSRESLYLNLYKREYDGMDRTLDVRISHLRKKIGDDADNSERIKTVWGHGYLFVPDAW